jgi:formate hydrogenlyase subunit 3/multisubunit Na+/H+ antiporter MnhD subunit
MVVLVGGALAACVLLAWAGVVRLRLIRSQARWADRVGSAILGATVIAAAGYGLFRLLRYLFGRPDWMSQ